MKHLLKISIVGILLLISIQAAYSTEQARDLLLINNKKLELLEFPLERTMQQLRSSMALPVALRL